MSGTSARGLTRRGSSAASEDRAVSDNESVEPDERKAAEDDAEEDLELQDEAAERVQGGRPWDPNK
jgi:hypothetical protein